jgi:predicted Zn-dependent protease
MKRIHDYLLLVAALVCTLMIALSVQAQSAGSFDTDSSNRRHGDVQNIGNRNVAGRIFGILPNVVPLEKETVLGRQMATEFEQTVKLLEDPVITEYIDRLGQNLVKHSDAKIPFHIKVVDANAADVLALPGGFLYVNKGLILEADSESELAGGMAHGIAHVCARHATQLQSKGQYLHLSNPTVSAGEPLSQTVIHYSYNSGQGIGLELVAISREFEMEADQLGIQYLWNTGYNPNAFVSLLEKMQVKEKSNPARSAALSRTYPSTADRIAQCLEEERALPKKDLYITSSPEFDRVKARLLADR